MSDMDASNWPGTFSLQRVCVDQADGAGSSALGSEILSSPASVTRLIAPPFPDMLHPPTACSNGILQQAYVLRSSATARFMSQRPNTYECLGFESSIRRVLGQSNVLFHHRLGHHTLSSLGIPSRRLDYGLRFTRYSLPS